MTQEQDALSEVHDSHVTRRGGAGDSVLFLIYLSVLGQAARLIETLKCHKFDPRQN